MLNSVEACPKETPNTNTGAIAIDLDFSIGCTGISPKTPSLEILKLCGSDLPSVTKSIINSYQRGQRLLINSLSGIKEEWVVFALAKGHWALRLLGINETSTCVLRLDHLRTS
eukprot:Blabericola_migrator_1__7525@NODE_3845_length_1473_cov_5_017070_g2384_i0_p3_GENE_NODE_3845_length_1473_cov_5_017070_g2384_i0NODE_3845_length_1473_cov_5_017070_g2384_i0_p3_ORF_typecomplete_len113_score7_45HIGH_NTase1/PF05636_11/0_088_NODE_3845_length_1473_cov_5_017070_g2384_i010551393